MKLITTGNSQESDSLCVYVNIVAENARCGWISDLTEKNVRLKLTIVDTTGFGDQINKADR